MTTQATPNGDTNKGDKTMVSAHIRRRRQQIQQVREKLELAYGRAVDNELAEGLDLETAKDNVLKRAAAYADTFGLDSGLFESYVKELRRQGRQ